MLTAIGFRQPERGTIAFKLDPGAPWDRGKGNFGGRVWFTPGANAAPFEFSSSTDRTYLIQVEVAWGLRGPGIARPHGVDGAMAWTADVLQPWAAGASVPTRSWSQRNTSCRA